MNRVRSSDADARMCVAAMTILVLLGPVPAYAQQSAWTTAGPAASSQYAQPQAQYLAPDGNPFLRQGPPRATLLAASGAGQAIPPASAGTAMPNIPSPGDLAGGPVMPVVASPIVAQQTWGQQPGLAPSQTLPPTIAPPNPVLPNVAGSADPSLAYAGAPPPQAAPVSAAPPLAQEPLHGLAILLQKPADPQQHPLAPVAAWAEDALAQMQGLADYSCTFKKREAVDGRLQEQQTMFVKARLRPFSVYMYFLDQDVRGQEALYVEGRNNGHIVAHPIGFKQTLVGTLSLAPDDPQAMQGNRYPITTFGIPNLMHRYLEGTRRELQFGESDVRVIENAAVSGRPCTCIQVSHPVARREFPYSMTRLYIDNEYNLPIRYEGYEWPRRQGEQPTLAEEYTYSNLKLNQGFSDADFDPRNPQYGYK